MSAAVAAALAAAFLDAPWEAPQLAAAGRWALGLRRAAWLDRLAADVVAQHPRPPCDAPRALTALLVAHPELASAQAVARRRGRPLRVRHLVAVPAAMGRARWPVPPLGGAADLAALLEVSPGELDWFADVRGWQRRAEGTALHHYRASWVAKRGAPRLLEAPKPRLRALQRRLLREVLGAVPAPPVVHGFVPGRSAVTGAREHCGAAVVVRVDLTAFFASVDAARTYRAFRSLGYPEAVAHLLTGLTTHATPARDLRGMPPGGDADERFALRHRLAAAHLPQGAPTSPALANLCARSLDRRLAGLAAALGARVTRYADDVTFSGGEELAAGAQRLVRCVTRVAADEGFTVNPAKTTVRGRGERQLVTGVVVNERPNPVRSEFDRLKAVLHRCAVHGPASVEAPGGVDLRSHLAGRVGWVEALSPSRGRRLRESFDAIAW
ncbi:reverse transcriptase family protein [Paenibacillus sp. TRM 82003]|uniref:reverse transcriptase family protein n=1 Tax=Kineococcus sp. TRM81007 TaxID=2925831 RepID=UPI001F5A0F7D|nr:reverse transcriptase family protein [Kineococcus sp. TRM81007]MCI2237429.1 reverse transcriptase family protein [Kineococcus sp. TRM81007]MCI3919781.1 reverse transcriptase family protein [Paenibacillus sp. TRM 82003]